MLVSFQRRGTKEVDFIVVWTARNWGLSRFIVTTDGGSATVVVWEDEMGTQAMAPQRKPQVRFKSVHGFVSRRRGAGDIPGAARSDLLSLLLFLYYRRSLEEGVLNSLSVSLWSFELLWCVSFCFSVRIGCLSFEREQKRLLVIRCCRSLLCTVIHSKQASNRSFNQCFLLYFPVVLRISVQRRLYIWALHLEREEEACCSDLRQVLYDTPNACVIRSPCSCFNLQKVNCQPSWYSTSVRREICCSCCIRLSGLWISWSERFVSDRLALFLLSSSCAIEICRQNCSWEERLFPRSYT